MNPDYRSFVEISDIQNNPPPLPPPPRAINILHCGNGYVLDESIFQQILLHPKYADKKVCIVSIVGPFKKGKSYLLNFFLRYLEWCEKSANEKSDDWLENVEDKLEGFEWKNSSEHTTRGIQIWSKPFLVKNDKNEEIVVLLMDTEGSSHSDITLKDSALISMLSAMLSSIQIYNTSQNIDELDLQNLWFSINYQKIVFENNFNEKPFQNLLILIRDWSYPYVTEYGFDGGQRILDKVFTENEDNTLRKTIQEAYEKMSCFLMPHPGLEAIHQKQFRQELIEKEFLTNLRKLISNLFDPENIVVKKVNNQEITCREFYEHFKKSLINTIPEDMPPIMPWLQAFAEVDNLKSLEEAKTYYHSKMNKIYGNCSPKKYKKQHNLYFSEAIEIFKRKPKIGGNQYSDPFLKKLEDEIIEEYENAFRENVEIDKKKGLLFGTICYWVKENLCECIF